MSRPSLRDALAAQLRDLPNSTELGLTVLQSTPKRTTKLYPHAPSAAVKCWEIEYLVVVHCGLPSEPSEANGEANGASSSTAAPSASSTPSVLGAAISAHLYTLPSTASEPPSSLLYISKVDSSGYTTTSGPLTRALAVGVLAYFLTPATRPGGPDGRVAATLFARSQGQYLFPNSVEGGGKRVLGGLGLCQWWKSVYEEASGKIASSSSDTNGMKMRYLLPSYSAEEAKGMLGAPRRALPPKVAWEYAAPFGEPLFSTDLGASLATMIPSLPDDPKTRFLDELIASALEAPVVAKKSQRENGTGNTRDLRTRNKEREEVEEEEERRRAHAALAKVPVEEFWERMGFRQECASGDVTGFFSMLAGPASPASGEEAKEETGEGAKARPNGEQRESTDEPRTRVPQTIVDRVLAAMLNTDFGTRALAAHGTGKWLESTRALVEAEIGEEGWKACTATIPAKAGVAPAPVLKRKEETVTMLQPRKKKK